MFCAHLHSNSHQKGAVNIFGAIFVDCVKIEDDDSAAAAASKTTAKQCVPDSVRGEERMCGLIHVS